MTETQLTEGEDTPETNTPLPSTPVQCSTSHGTRPTQPEDGLQMPIRATVSAEVTPTKEISPEKGKLKTIEKEKPKNHKVHFEPPTDLRRSNRIKDAKRTEKLGRIEYFSISATISADSLPKDKEKQYASQSPSQVGTHREPTMVSLNYRGGNKR